MFGVKQTLNCVGHERSRTLCTRRRKQPGMFNAPDILEYRVVQLGAERDKKGNRPREWIRMAESPLTLKLSDEELQALQDNPLAAVLTPAIARR